MHFILGWFVWVPFLVRKTTSLLFGPKKILILHYQAQFVFGARERGSRVLRSCFGLILGIGIISIDPRSGEKRGAGDDAPGGAGSLLGPDSGGPVPADWLSEFKNLLEGMNSLVLGGGGEA